MGDTTEKQQLCSQALYVAAGRRERRSLPKARSGRIIERAIIFRAELQEMNAKRAAS